MSQIDTIQDFVEYTRLLYQRHLVHAEGGNTSLRRGDEVWITRTGAVLGRVTEAELTRLALSGEVLEGPPPSKEWPMHLAYYHARPQTRAVIHLHPTYSIAYSTTIEPSLDAVPAYSSAVYRRAGRVPMVPYYPVGSLELFQAIEALAPHFPCVLLRQHGLTVASDSLSSAMGIVEEIEQACHIGLLTHGKGQPLSAAEKAAIDQRQGRTWPTTIRSS